MEDKYMTLSNKLKANIFRHYQVKKWRVGILARQLHVYRSVVKKMLSQAGTPKETLIKRHSVITPLLSFATNTLTNYSSLAASRLYEMLHPALILNSFSHFFVMERITLLFNIHPIKEEII
ncbi:MAG: homeo-like domain protein [Gammaproteobacteria bacterium]|jgi:hypothetical protein|nr:homeo-like domain protein [Gammaproteobacteria bacterium]